MAPETDSTRCLDPGRMIPISRRTTALFHTGSWGNRRPSHREKVSPCRAECPLGNDIPLAAGRVRRGDFDGALEVFLRENPLPGVCGRVCYEPCRSRCNRGEEAVPVAIRALERAAAELGSARATVLSDAGRDRPVAVVGSGPAGLACAYHAARMGHPVTLFEAEAELGGLLRWGIPEFRLPKAALDRDLSRLLALGVAVRTGVRVDETHLHDLRRANAAVFLAPGATADAPLGIPGEGLDGVVSGLSFLRTPELQARARGAVVAVIGGGNTALDAARTARRWGAREVLVLYRRERGDMPAFPEEIEEAEEEGIAFRFRVAPVEFRGDAALRSVRLAEVGAGARDGERRPEALPGTEFDLPCDLALVAAGQKPVRDGSLDGLRWEEGRVWVDACGQTSAAHLFAGGDCLRQRASVVDALASGKRAALAIHHALTGRAPLPALEAVRLAGGRSLSAEATFRPRPAWDAAAVATLRDPNPATLDLRPPGGPPSLEPAARSRGFDEVNGSWSAEEASEEAKRCFYCGTCVACDRCFLLCPDLSILPPTAEEPGYRVDPDYCKGCGICASACPGGVVELRENP